MISGITFSFIFVLCLHSIDLKVYANTIMLNFYFCSYFFIGVLAYNGCIFPMVWCLWCQLPIANYNSFLMLQIVLSDAIMICPAVDHISAYYIIIQFPGALSNIEELPSFQLLISIRIQRYNQELQLNLH